MDVLEVLRVLAAQAYIGINIGLAAGAVWLFYVWLDDIL